MTDLYIEKLVKENPRYQEKYINNEQFRDAVDKYTHEGSAEMVIKILFDICK